MTSTMEYAARVQKVANEYQTQLLAPKSAPIQSRGFSPAKQSVTPIHRTWQEAIHCSVSRIYEAAKYDRHTEGWFGDWGVSQWDILGQLQIVRNRSREMVKNDPHLTRWIWQRRNNIIGAQGFTLKMDVCEWKTKNGKEIKISDSNANRLIETAFNRWAECPDWADYHGRKTLTQILWGIDKDFAREGEGLIEICAGPQSGNPFKFSLWRHRPDELALMFCAVLDNGNNVFNGVEVDDRGRVVAYWVWTKMLPTGIWSGPKRRVPATMMLHLYDEDYEGQNRGFPIVACVLRSVKLLHQYIDAEVIKARRQAYSSGTWRRDPQYVGDSDPKDIADPQTDDTRTQFMQQIEPGEDRLAPPGWLYDQPQPTAPNPVFGVFKQEMLRIVASGIGAAYHNLASDFASINWSAGRLAENEQREGWMSDQYLYITKILRPLFRRDSGWLAFAMASGQVTLPFSKLAKFRESDEWRGKRWFPADPAHEIPMLETMVRRGWTSDSAIAAQFGGSFIENVEQTRQDDRDSEGTAVHDRNAPKAGAAAPISTNETTPVSKTE